MGNYKQLTSKEEIDKSYQEAEKIDPNIKLFTFIAWALIICGSILLISFVGITTFTKNKIDFQLLIDSIAGVIGTLWSLASVFIVYVAFLGQKKQLIYQKIELIQNREELRLNTEELRGQKKELNEQNKTFAIQRFENSFYNLLTLFNSIVNEMNVNISRKEFHGREVFKQLYNNFSYIDKEDADLDINIFIEAYGNFYSKYYDLLSHYFRTLYQLIKLVDLADIDSQNKKIKKRYTSIVRAQLSSYEQLMLFYNCLHNNGRDKFKPLIEKYGLFNNIDRSLLINKNHTTQYEDCAFK